MSEKITLSGVPKTRGTITDNKAVELIDRLDYDFSMADKDAAMHSGVIARTIVLDKLVKTYLAGHGGAVVENMACGLLPHERLFAARWPTASKTDRFRRLQGKCRSTASSNSAARRTTSSTATR